MLLSDGVEKTIDQVLYITIFLSFTIIVSIISYRLLGFNGLLAFGIMIISITILLNRKWRQFREKGLIYNLGTKIRKMLLERSILDIFRDVVYFPYITKIIGTIFTIATTKPHPQDIPQILKQLPKQVYQISTRKGLLSLTPSAIESLILPQNNRSILPINYGKHSIQWDHLDEYHKVQSPVHQQTLQKRIVHLLDSRLGWPSALVMLGIALVGARHMNHKRFKKMVIQNVTFCCLFFSFVAMIIKLRKLYQLKKKKNKPFSIQEINKINQ